MTNKTDRTVLYKGIKTMIFALLSLFMGPIMLSIAFNNKEKPLYIPILILGCLISAMAIYLLFRGINTIMNSMFKRK
ncbi:DUF6095 family protein [Yeosuana sp. AK3]|nr:hypothetical protein [Flavobacteriia bacterium]NCP05779.1 hypothetical protein [Flavobacteriales bacterium]PIV93620.1 MAG: hypothetical protein COW44_08670 [Flavobacteriaceae bacterium CG17_big_fil_post_rev_8_21_14_2_50_33_15]PIY13034.1 MAG: hypothetical protein COZ17_01745 [Flavobacteriaceae bacterium CG_4_10_14_3_um_filter_33_47]PJB16695.1 MAG: hypothetical protein CO117_14425 [Flavobacteriaceae bacterium CG_4_9_14_3_um_filter_33_16]